MDRIVLLLACVGPVVRCYSSGQVMDSCENLQPRHAGLSPQTGPTPFHVRTDRSSYRLGEEVKVQLLAPASTPFIGFLLQARAVGGWSPLGSFILAGGTGHASFVQNYRTFWVNVTSPTLTFNNERGGLPTTSAKGSASVITATITVPRVPRKTTSPGISISRDDCGLIKLCFSHPPNCDPAGNADCYFMSARMFPNNTEVHYEMTGASNGYVSFGFSDDQKMGNDDIYICAVGSGGLVQLQHAFSTGQTLPQALPLGNISDVKASAQDEVISCSFTSSNTISTQRTDKAYHLLFAHGPSSNGHIQFHTATFSSADKVDISRPQLVRTARLPHIIKAHGALMLVAWMTTGTLGMMVARYLKGAATRQNLCGKDIWFLVHVAVMSVTVAATVIGFILSFSYVKAWSGGAHPVLGCLVVILSFLQLILALLRCGPQHPQRFVFNWSHALNGLTIKALAVAAIFTGLALIDSTPNQWLMKVMGGFLGWEVVFFISLDIHFKWKIICAERREEHTGGRHSLKEVGDCKVVVGESVSSQQRLVVRKMTLVVKKRKRTKVEQRTKWRLKNEECCVAFREETTIAIFLIVLFFLGNMIFLVALLIGIAVS
ncbi:putative ferric-chelate reductase 1 [Brachionichthys hirsutus]|uniref:putative ferric-chelate reductase 1 n=1 Tax=Brachionichthys hirsutus TaxID=412623 RepID=UPI0036051A43